MTVTVLIAALLVALIVHESAHALALRTMGIPISEAGLGLPFPPRAQLKPSWLPFKVSVSPWLLGAYVMPHTDHHKQIDTMPYRQRAWFLNAGIIANIIAGLTIWSFGYALAGRPVAAIVTSLIAGAVWVTRKQIAAFVLPALALPLLILTAVLIGGAWAAGDTGMGFASLGETVPTTGGLAYLAFFGTLNFAVAAMNTLPLFGLDNGKVVRDVLKRWAGSRATKVYEVAGLVTVGLMLVASIGSDLWAGVSALVR